MENTNSNSTPAPETCPGCEAEITERNPLIDAERYSVGPNLGYCDNCYDPTPYYPDLGF
jgi:hypothetical protein